MGNVKFPKALMIQGTGSDVGKSLIVTGLCRALKNHGLNVYPFKPQNMSNNAAVTNDGGEIGRAQALQARAARIPPSCHMNPVLLKPQTEVGSQIIVQGKVFGNAKASDYYKLKPKLLSKVLESFNLIIEKADVVLIEGAGSPAEKNLEAGDIANMGFANEVDVPVILVADIDRGGVIANLVGTHAVLTKRERQRVKGFIINKFRGDINLFDSGINIIESNTGWSCFGVVPYLSEAKILPQEDALALDMPRKYIRSSNSIKIAIPRLTRIANFDDFDPLVSEPDVFVNIVEPDQPLPLDSDIIIIPGSKSTISDLNDLRRFGWDIDILAHHRQGGVIVGICGGFQILGKSIDDPNGIEGSKGCVTGLGLLDIATVINGNKVLEKVEGIELSSGAKFGGYEMHVGKTLGPGLKRPWLQVSGYRNEGACSENGLVFGAYVHGLFSADSFRQSFLSRCKSGQMIRSSHDLKVENALDTLGGNIEKYVDFESLADL